jgi:hypothetical protein
VTYSEHPLSGSPHPRRGSYSRMAVNASSHRVTLGRIPGGQPLYYGAFNPA